MHTPLASYHTDIINSWIIKFFFPWFLYRLTVNICNFSFKLRYSLISIYLFFSIGKVHLNHCYYWHCYYCNLLLQVIAVIIIIIDNSNSSSKIIIVVIIIYSVLFFLYHYDYLWLSLPLISFRLLVLHWSENFDVSQLILSLFIRNVNFIYMYLSLVFFLLLFLHLLFYYHVSYNCFLFFYLKLILSFVQIHHIFIYLNVYY